LKIDNAKVIKNALQQMTLDQLISDLLGCQLQPGLNQGGETEDGSLGLILLFCLSSSNTMLP